MGERPPGMTVDRINNDGNYEPGNCRWATQMTQGSNRGNNRRVVIDEKEMTISAAARLFGISLITVRSRLRTGWPIEDALKTPVSKPRGTRNAQRAGCRLTIFKPLRQPCHTRSAEKMKIDRKSLVGV